MTDAMAAETMRNWDRNCHQYAVTAVAVHVFRTEYWTALGIVTVRQHSETSTDRQSERLQIQKYAQQPAKGRSDRRRCIAAILLLLRLDCTD